MAKKIIENIANLLPDAINNVISYIKDNFDKNGEKLLENAGGTTAVLLKLFTQPLIDKYFDNKSEKKLANYGFNTYFKAALIQAKDSLEYIEDKIPYNQNYNDGKKIFELLNSSIEIEIQSFKKEEAILIFQPIYHPAIKFVKNTYEKILKQLNVEEDTQIEFIHRFNDGIEDTIKREFGSDYESHINNISKLIRKDNEIELLLDTITKSKIGFKGDENLKYEETFAYWKRVSTLRDKDNAEVDRNNQDYEKNLKPIESLINEYFSISPENNLDKILFVIADFGKGKSVFMRHFASKLATSYLKTGEGHFPIYFNLRDYKNYSNENTLGVISDYLETRYSIKINDEYFQRKKYFFLIDSLDESGELNKRSIDKVIASIKNIQGINKTLYKSNRIMVTSRPFDEGLSHHLMDHNPFVIKNKEGREVPYFINIYGFTKIQFNSWLQDTLEKGPELSTIKANDISQKIIDSVISNTVIDIHAELLKNNTLSYNELRRPIFAYMIYQLIINNVDFLAVGKVGIYLSFLNLLTKEAKHIHDADYKVNLKEEFEFRNVLHSTASLWMLERQHGKQGSLQKSDICRVLEGKNTGESDSEILERFKGQGFTEIQFLSHSYFGENDNVLHFQHQSFAEILLAEYYLKIFIKYALDEDAELDEARTKLSIGEPTEQTIIFLSEILRLLRDTSVSDINQDIIEKRKLLFPLMASLSIQKYNNKLLCNDLKYSWYNKCEFDDNETKYPISSIENWCLDSKRLEKIIDLATNIISSKNSYIPIIATQKTALYSNEILEIKKHRVSNLSLNIDKWLALLVGNTLYNIISENSIKLYNKDKNIAHYDLFDLIRGWNFTNNDSSPNWGRNLFMGINMEVNDNLDASHYNFDGIDFSYSNFTNLRCWAANFCRTTLDNCSFVEVDFITSLFMESSFHNIQKIDNLYMTNCQVSTRIKLLDALKTINFKSRHPIQTNKTNIRNIDIDGSPFDIYKTFSGFMIYGLKNSFFTVLGLKKMFSFDDEKTKKEFYKKINELKQYEVKRK